MTFSIKIIDPCETNCYPNKPMQDWYVHFNTLSNDTILDIKPIIPDAYSFCTYDISVFVDNNSARDWFIW